MPGGGTPIGGATILAYAAMHKAALDAKIYGIEFVVLITDGAQSEQCPYTPRCTNLLVDDEVPKAAGKGAGFARFGAGFGRSPQRRAQGDRAPAVSCELNVPVPDQGDLDLSLVNVVCTPSGDRPPVVVRQDDQTPCEGGADGWRYTNGNTKIQLCGAICDTVRGDDGARVDVVLGCPVVRPT